MSLMIDLKCGITTAIVSVLIFLLLEWVLSKYITEGLALNINNTEWYKSLEVLLLISVFLGYIANSLLFSSCRV